MNHSIVLELSKISFCFIIIINIIKQFDETIGHIISAFPILAKEQYIKRHDSVCALLHFNICKGTGQKTLV